MKVKINAHLLYTALLSSSFVTLANEKNKHLWVETDVNNRVCWYQDKKYSQGALLVVNEYTLVCELKYPQQTNGPLAWLKVDKNGNPIYPKPIKRITVN